jgi:hypothetical protein
MKNIHVGRAGLFALGLLLGFSLAFAAISEQRVLSLSRKIESLSRPANITELEWRFVRTRLGEVEEQVNVLSQTGIGSCCARYWYDATKNKIIARFRYGPDTLNRLTVQEAKNRLSTAANGAIGATMAELEQESGVKLDPKDFEVEFVTWDEHAHFKTFAVYRNDQVEFVDHPLK